MKKSDILQKYIIDKYGSIAKFLKKEKFSRQELEIVFQKKEFFHELSIGVKICGVLNIDAVRLFCKNEIAVLENGKEKELNETSNMSLDDIIKEKYSQLDEDDRKKALDYAEYIFKNGDGTM